MNLQNLNYEEGFQKLKFFRIFEFQRWSLHKNYKLSRLTTEEFGRGAAPVTTASVIKIQRDFTD